MAARNVLARGSIRGPAGSHPFVLCARLLAAASAQAVVSHWQRAVSLRWLRTEQKPLWQQDYWDRQLRSGESYAEKWNYVRNNPVRHGLVG